MRRIALRSNLKKRPGENEHPKPDLAKLRTQPLADAELAAILAFDVYQGWYGDNFGNSEARYLTKTFKFRGFNQPVDFMNLVAIHGKVLDHHLEWRNVFNHVNVALRTWYAHRKVTIYNVNLALCLNMSAKGVVSI